MSDFDKLAREAAYLDSKTATYVGDLCFDVSRGFLRWAQWAKEYFQAEIERLQCLRNSDLQAFSIEPTEWIKEFEHLKKERE